jgi:uncharacterized membrane protein
MEEKKTMLGLTENLESTLCYALSWITGIIFLVLEKENKLVRFHAIQSIITFLGLTIASVVIGVIPFIGQVLGVLIGIGSFILWIVLLVRTYQGEKFVVPFAGEMAEKQTQ